MGFAWVHDDVNDWTMSLLWGERPIPSPRHRKPPRWSRFFQRKRPR